MAFLKLEGADQNIELGTDEVTIGRGPDNQVVLDNPSVSSFHCSIVRDGRKYLLRDHNSTNGTFVNGDRIRERQLSPGDDISVGSVALVIGGDDIEPAAEPAGEPSAAKPSAAKPSVGKSSVGKSAAAPPPAAFGTRRRSSKGIWMAVIIAAGVLALAAAGWYVYQLLGGR